MTSHVASEAYHDWSGEAADAQLRVNYTLKLLLSQNFCNQPLMRFISFASNIGPAAAVPAGPAPAPLLHMWSQTIINEPQGLGLTLVTGIQYLTELSVGMK